MLIYAEHCVPFVVIKGSHTRYVNCPICNAPVKAYPLRTIIYKRDKPKLVKVISILDDKRKNIHEIYDESLISEDINREMINDFMTIIDGMVDLRITDVARLYADLLGIYYLHTVDSEKLSHQLTNKRQADKLSLLALARQWFLSSGNIYLKIIADSLFIKEIIVLDDTVNPEELRLFYGTAYNLALENIEMIRRINDDDIEKSLYFFEEVKDFLREAYMKSLDIYKDVKVAEIYARAIENLGKQISRAIELHGELIRKGLTEVSRSIEIMGQNVASGLRYLGDKVSLSINRMLNEMRVTSSKISRSLFLSALTSGIFIGSSQILTSFLNQNQLSQINSMVNSSVGPLFGLLMSTR